MDPASYDHWYDTPRGRWIGQRETALIVDRLRPRPGESLLDIGCGTGYFTRALAAASDGPVTGIDIDPAWLAFARHRDTGSGSYAVADACALPFAAASFDLAISITALCFVDEEPGVVREILRVTRRRFAIGLLNRRSLLYLGKGQDGGRGAYRGARWHTAAEARALFDGSPVHDLSVHTAIQVPGGGRLARLVECASPSSLPTGGFLLVVGDIARGA